MIKTLKLFVLIGFFTLLSGACDNPFTSLLEDRDPQAKNLPAGKGSFSLKIAGRGRTIMPKDKMFNEESLSYRFTFTPTLDGTEQTFNRTYAELETPVVLDLGTYELVVNAYGDAGQTQLLMSGSADNIFIQADIPTEAEITLQPATGGNGTGVFSWEITFPEIDETEKPIKTANMVIVNRRTNEPAGNSITLFDRDATFKITGTATGERVLPPGFYDITITMTGRNMNTGDIVTATRREILHIYSGFKSEYTNDFTDVSFAIHDVIFWESASHYSTLNVTHGDTIGDYYLNGGFLASFKPASNALLYEGAGPASNVGGYTFEGWYLEDYFDTKWGNDDIVTETITLYPKWNSGVDVSSSPGADNFAKIVNFLNGITPAATVTYTLFIADDVTLTQPITVKSNVTLTVTSVGGRKTIFRGFEQTTYDSGLFVVANGANMTFENIEIDGNYWDFDNDEANSNFANNGAALVKVNYGGTFILDNEAVLKNNQAGDGGGVYTVGEFTMRGTAVITNNIAGGGGGVFISGEVVDGDYEYSGTFIMVGGEIKNNEADRGGGVRLNQGNTFTMIGGEISYNTAGGGGGVVIDTEGTFNMVGGRIEHNKCTGKFGGGGVNVSGDDSMFTMNGGFITDNEAGTSTNLRNGGGVSISDGTFIMNDGNISRNKSFGIGGGVYMSDGKGIFTMSGGIITDNEAAGNDDHEEAGGGAYIGVGSGIFTLDGTAQIKGNKNSYDDSDNNLFLGGYITLGANLGVPAEIHVQIPVETYDNVIVNTGATQNHLQYIKGDGDSRYVYFEEVGGEGKLLLGYFISNPDELAAIAAQSVHTSKYYMLKNDIVLTSWDTPIGKSWDKRFRGNFDGNGKKITFNNISLSLDLSNSSDEYGLFADIDGGTVKNLVLEGNITINAEGNPNCVGVLAGSSSGLIENVSSTVNISFTKDTRSVKLGGIVGENYGGIVKNCFNIGTIDIDIVNPYEDFEVGGVAGFNSGTVENCYATGDITVTQDGESGNAGGVVGNNTGTVRNCYATGNVDATGSVSISTGGVVGTIGTNDDPTVEPKVENCYATGNVTATADDAYAGGVVGLNDSKRVAYCVALNTNVTGTGNTTAVGRVVGTSIGTLAGNFAWDGMTGDFSDDPVDNSQNGKNGADVFGLPLPPAYTNALFWTLDLGYDEDIWLIGENRLPILKNMPAGEQNPIGPAGP